MAREDWLADGLLEIALGVGFWGSGGLFVRLADDLANRPVGLASAVLRFVAGLALLCLLLPGLVLLGKRLLRRRGWQAPPAAPATWTRALPGLVLGAPLIGALSWLSAGLTVESPQSAAAQLPLLVGLLTATIPLAFGFVAGRRRFYALLLPVAASGWLLTAFWPAAAPPSLPQAGLVVWLFTGLLFFLSGVVVWLLSWRRRAVTGRLRRKGVEDGPL